MAQRNDYTATAAQTVFTYTFQIFDTDEIDVYVNDVLQTETTNYTVSNNTLPLIGGTITLVTPSTSGDAIALVQDIPIERDITYQTDGDFKAAVVNTDFDKIYTLLKQGQPNSEISDRLIKFADSEDRSSNTNLIPSPVSNQYLTWNATGDLVNTAAPTVSINETPTVANVAAVKALDVASVQSCYMESLSAPRDGGQNHFYYDASSGATPDDQLVIKPDSVTLPANGRWLALPAQTLGIQDDAVTTNKILDDAVTTAKIADYNITQQKLGWYPLSVVDGLKCTNGTDADHDINIAVGSCADTTQAYVMTLGSALVKQIDATWADSSATGGCSNAADSGVVQANTWYGVFLLSKSTDPTACNAIFAKTLANSLADTNAIAAGYDISRLIECRLTDGSANIIPSVDGGNNEHLFLSMIDSGAAASATRASLVVDAPPFMQAILAVKLYIGSSGIGQSTHLLITNLSQTDDTPSASLTHCSVYFDNTTNSPIYNNITRYVKTNASSAIGVRTSNTANVDLDIQTIGWKMDYTITDLV